jgi:2-oxoglutarate dehydrogenase E1 component
MSPKSLLRLPAATSKLAEFTSGTFEEILLDPQPPKQAKRLILCSGKVYYDLDAYRTANNVTDTALVRIEQIYPLHTAKLAEIAKAHPKAKLIWCQEESQNNGAWSFLAPQLEEIFGRKATYAGRDASASPAVGSLAVHKQELAAFLKDAFTSEINREERAGSPRLIPPPFASLSALSG